MKISTVVRDRYTKTMNTNWKISRTIQILFYLTLLYHQLASGSGTYDAGKQQDDDNHPVSGCKYTYPKYMISSPNVDMILCRNTAPSELPVYPNVTKMELINVPLTVLNQTEIPKAVQSDKVDLRQLYWTKSHIKVIQSVTIPTLNELDLSGNIIQEIREEAFEPLFSLYKLNISNNRIENLPEKLFTRIYPLRTFSLSHNKLKILPGDIFDTLRDLEILDLSNNELNYLREDTFVNNPKLQTLNLSNNKLNSLPERIFHSLTSLQHLSLQNNVLIHLELQTFSKLQSLMILDMGENPLWTLPPSLLPVNNTLFILTISHTKLVKIQSTVFQNLANLRKLYLSENRNLQNLPNDTFVNSEKLKMIDLQNNNFTQLPHSLVNLVPDELLLSGNPWPCDCSIQWIINWIKSLGEARNNVRLASYCNSTDKDLVETVYRMQCKPTIIRVSPVSNYLLEAKVQLVCRAYATPRPLISWVTPNGLAYIKSESAIDLLRYHPTFDLYPHLGSTEENVELHENGDLDIKSMTREDAGEYLCIATNKVGEAFAHTRLYVDPSIMQRIKTGSLICGLLWINGFLLFSVVYVLLRKCTKR